MLRNKPKQFSTLIVKSQKLFQNLRTLVLFSVALLLSAGTAFSQASDSKFGKITGKVVDSEIGETIIGANVTITGTGQGDATDLDGNYTIRMLEPGVYSVTVSYISYTRKIIEGVQVSDSEVTTLNIALDPETVGLDEVVVTASADRSGEAGLLSVQRKSVPVQDGISSEQISKLGDSDVGSAIKRVTGVTVQNGKDVFVRGLGNRYSNVQLNGSQLPSTNPNKKEAPIDLFGSGLVSNIVVQKTYTADQSAEFSGGSVNITTREFPEERNLTIGYSTKYTSVSTFENTLSSGGSSTDFLGFDDGERSLPTVLSNERVNGSNAAVVAEGLHNNWNITDEKSAIPSQSFSVNYANQFNEERMPVGLVSNFSYKFSRNLQPNKVTRSILNFSDSEPNYYSDYMHNEGVESADLSGMLNLFVKPSPVTKIGQPESGSWISIAGLYFQLPWRQKPISGVLCHPRFPGTSVITWQCAIVPIGVQPGTTWQEMSSGLHHLATITDISSQTRKTGITKPS
jgi:hypothetical protein